MATTVKTTKDGSAARSKSRKKPLRVRAYRRLAKRKHRVLGALAYAGLGSGALLRASVKWTVIGGGRGSRWAYRRVSRQVRTEAQRRKWTPPPGNDRVPRSCVQSVCNPCQKPFNSPEALNQHMLAAHRHEQRQASRPTHQIQRSVTRRTAGKTIVRPAVAGGGRHRLRHNLPGAKRIAELVAAYDPHLRKIGDLVMSAETAAAHLGRAAKAFGDQPTPRTLADLRAGAVGFERAMGILADALGNYARTLVVRAKVDPMVVRPYWDTAREHVENAGRCGTQFIAAFEELYSLQIAAANRADLAAPNLDLSKTG